MIANHNFVVFPLFAHNATIYIYFFMLNLKPRYNHLLLYHVINDFIFNYVKQIPKEEHFTILSTVSLILHPDHIIFFDKMNS